MGKKSRPKVKRDKQGRFKSWPGGGDSKENGYSHHGTVVHIGQEFKRQNNRSSKVGDVVRKKTKDGSYHQQANFWIKTKHGWRETQFKRKPTKSQINEVLEKSRPGRS